MSSLLLRQDNDSLSENPDNMKKNLLKIAIFSLLLQPLWAQELFTEIQASVTADGPPYTFRVLGDKEAGSFSAYGIHVIAPDGKEHMLDQFDSLLPEGSEPDALIVEDVNFDGYNDLRIMKYLPGGANVPYYFWIYNPAKEVFEENEAFEVVVSPTVDTSAKELISRQRVSAAEYHTEFYRTEAGKPVLVRRDERVFSSDGSSVMKSFTVAADGTETLIDTKKLGPES